MATRARRARRLVAAVAIAALASIGVVVAATGSTESAIASQVTACPAPINLVNGSFEDRAVGDGAGGDVNSATDTQIGWKTTESDHQIELWRAQTPTSVSGNNFGLHTQAEDGVQWAELNANDFGALYQDVTTVPGQTLAWSIWHMARASNNAHTGNDVMRVYIGNVVGQSPTLSDVIGQLQVQVPDQAAPGDTSGDISDGPLEWHHYTGTYVVPAGQTDTRFAFAAVSSSNGDPTVGNFLDDIQFSNAPCLPATKSVQNLSSASGGLVRPGDTLQYTETVPNNGGSAAADARLTDDIPSGTTYVPGTLQVDGVAVTDATGDDTGDVAARVATARVGTGADGSQGGSFLPGNQHTLSFEVTVDTSDAAGTQLANTGHTSFVWPASTASTVGDTNTVTSTVSTTGITVVKHAASTTDMDGNGQLDSGDQIHYSYLVTNTGSTSLSSISVTDPAVTVTCPSSTLAAGTSETCTGTYTVTHADTDVGQVGGPATAAGTPPLGAATITSAPSTTTTQLDQAAGLTVVPTPDHASVGQVGDVVQYSSVATNTGNVTLSGVTVAGSISCTPATPATLAPGAHLTCVMPSHTTTQADLDHGSLLQTSTATATAPGNHPVAASGVASVTAAQDPALATTQTTTRSSVDAVGQSVPYTVVVTNTGNVTLTHVTPGDLRSSPGNGPITLHCPAEAPLAPGDSITCTGTSDVTQADLDSGIVTATASATATRPDGTVLPVSQTSVVTVAVTVSPALTVTPSAGLVDTTGNGRIGPGDIVHWSFLVTNTGNVSVSNPSVHDADAGDIVCPRVTLAPGAHVLCTASTPQTITAADMTARGLVTTATASASPACAAWSSCASPTSPPHSVSIALSAVSGLELTQTATVAHVHGGTATRAGDLVTWHMTVTNSGDLTATGLRVSGPNGGAVHCAVTTLAPGESTTCTSVTRVVTAAEARAGVVRNVASAYSSVGSDTVTSAPATASVVVARDGGSPTPSPTPSAPGGAALATTGAEGVLTMLIWIAALLAAGTLALGIARGVQRRR